jgi:hypothetical protein
MAYTNIDKPSDYFETKLYTGTGTTNAITGVGFAPDFVWSKNRQSALYHGLYDVVRGTGTTKGLSSNSNEAEGANANFINLTSFDSDGFTLGATVSTNQINTSGENHVAWNWLANGTGVSNTAGSITSTVSANTTSGFSIVSYTGNSVSATVGHGLGVAPKFIIIKHRNDADDWTCYHTSLGASQRIQLNNTGASSALSWGGSPTSSVFYLLGGGATAVNVTGGTYIAYCFADVKGFSKFGSYTGGSDPFVYLGFKPSFVMFKNASATENWRIVDNKRDVDNPVVQHLYPNLSNAEKWCCL